MVLVIHDGAVEMCGDETDKLGLEPVNLVRVEWLRLGSSKAQLKNGSPFTSKFEAYNYSPRFSLYLIFNNLSVCD